MTAKKGQFSILPGTRIIAASPQAFDGTNLDEFYPKYSGQPLDVLRGATEIRVITYQDGRPIGHQINYPLIVLKKRIEKE